MPKKNVRFQKTEKQNTKIKRPVATTKQMGSLEKFRRMATVIQDSNDAITFQDLEGNILAWNQGAEQIYGYSQAEALSMNIVDTVPKEYQEEARGFLASLKRGELVSNLETKRKHKDGRIIDVWLTNTKLTDDKGKLTGIATTERDITAQTKTLEKFRRMATVIQDSNDAITFQDLDGNILAWNQGAEQIYGYSEAEALRMNIVDTVPKEYQAEAREFLASLKRGELVPTLETKRKTKDGRVVDVWLTNTKLTDDKGILTGIATTERDISERMGSLEKFRRMATVIQDSNDAITFQDLEGNILAWNRGAEIIYGYSQAEALSMNIVDTVPAEYQEEARQFLSSLKRGELVPTLETKRKTKDGRIVDVWLTNTKLTDEKGKLTGIATTERNITERKHAEATLREKFRELDYLREGQIALSEKMRGEQIMSRLGQSILSHLVPFTNAQVGTFYLVIDDKKLQMVSGYALSKNQSSEKLIEFGEGLIGQVAIEKKSLLIEDVPSSYFNKIESSLGKMAPRSLLICPIFYENEVVGVIELGSLRPFTEHQRVFLTSVSENIGIAINTSDVRKKVQKQNEALNTAQVLLEEKANEVQRASRYKTEFLANMSHEIRTPVGAILGFTDLMKNPANTAVENRNYMGIIDRNSQQLLRLIDDILDLSKVEAGMMTVESLEFSLTEMLADFTSLMRFKAEEKGVRFQFTIDSLIPDLICSDPVRLRQILTNMVGNAIKFTDKGGVDLRVSFENPVLRFTVKDTGVGISKDQESRLFQPFTQADTSTTRKFGGTGLGLVLSKRLAERLGGRLELTESKEGYGSTFIIEIKSMLLPNARLVGQEALTMVAIEHPDLHKNNQALLGLKVLLVEDSPDNIILISTYLQKEGALVKTASDGASGVDLTLSENFDVILMDIQMPILDGHEAVKKLRQSKYTKPIVALTAHAMKEEREKCFESGFTEFLTKPIQLDLLIEVLTRYVPHRIETIILPLNE